MTEKELWKAFIAESQLSDCEYEAWAFGTDADLLAHLVLTGEKTATSSAYPLYELEKEPLPVAGEYSIILDSKDHAVCVVKTNSVSVVPFDEVTADHAFKEGEGDKSLDYWRKVHKKFFIKCLREVGLSFSTEMNVVCEEFEVVYKKYGRMNSDLN